MQIVIPKVTKFLPLQEYAPEEQALAGVGIHVWVDPPRAVLVEFDGLHREYRAVLEKLVKKLGTANTEKTSPGERMLRWLQVRAKSMQDAKFQSATKSYRRSLYAWYARLWSQSTDAETHWTAEELEQVNDSNPHLYEWLCNSSWAMIEQHQDDVKKGYRGPSAKLPAAGRPATPS
jgi:hypothetical protein